MDEPIFSLDITFESELQQGLFNLVRGPLEHLFSLPELNEIHAAAANLSSDRPFWDRVLDVLNIEVAVTEEDLARIPKEGPVLVVANHPFGAIEGLILGHVMHRVRSDSKLMANFLLQRIPELRDLFIFVDPFEENRGSAANRTAMREAIRWLKDGHMLGVFPAGKVAHLDLQTRQVTDPEWNSVIARFVRLSNASVVPLYFDGRNSPLFQVAGLIHPRLRTALLPRELINKEDETIDVRIGHPISDRKMEDFGPDRELVSYLRRRTYTLANRDPKVRVNGSRDDQEEEEEDEFDEIIGPTPTGDLTRDIDGLSDEHRLVRFDDLDVYYARAQQIPNLLRELGRLREVTFRAVGEGTGSSIDLDEYDQDYLHLFVWNREKRHLIGAYRFGQTDVLMNESGLSGLYTSTLFEYEPELLRQISPALEMGRAFVREEYQGSYRPLLLLWKGIGAFVVAHPRYRYLFGPVSVDNQYQTMSHQLLMQFLKEHNYRPEYAELVEPRTPFKFRPIQAWEPKALSTVVDDVREVSSLIDDIEHTERGVPVLLRQYLKLGGELLGFYVDPDFNNVVGGLILVDLLKTDREILNRYMGRTEAASFLAHHEAEGHPEDEPVSRPKN